MARKVGCAAAFLAAGAAVFLVVGAIVAVVVDEGESKSRSVDTKATMRKER